MNGFLKVALIGGAGYFLYESGLLRALTGGAIPAPASTSTTTTTSGASSATTTTTATTPTPATPGWQLALNAAVQATGQSAPQLTFDQWNYYAGPATGETFPDPTPIVGAPGTAGRDATMNVSSWWLDVKTANPGLQGLGRVRRSLRGIGQFTDLSMTLAAFPQVKGFDSRPPVNPLDPWGGAFN